MKHNSSYIYPQCAHLYPRKASNSFQSTVVYFGDGAASLYNNFKKLVNLCHHRRDHDLNAEWYFLLLAMGNRPVTKTSLQATVTNQILTPQHIFALAIACIKYLYISENDIAKNFQDFAHKENKNNRSLFVAIRVKKQTKNKVKDLTSKLGTRMETGRLQRDLLGLRVEQPPGLLFNGLI